MKWRNVPISNMFVYKIDNAGPAVRDILRDAGNFWKLVAEALTK